MRLKLILICGMFFYLNNCCYAKETVVSAVMSSDMGIYKDVLSGLNSFLAEKGVAVHINEHSLAGQEDKTVFSMVTAEKPDLIFTLGEPGLKSAKELTSGIPIVYSMVFDVSQYANQNNSGVLMEIPVEMKIAGIKKIFPKVKTIGMIYSPNSIGTYRDISSECAKQGLILNAKEINSENEFSEALNSVLSGSDCFLVVVDVKVYFTQTVKLLFLESAKRKIPVVGLSSFFTKAGAAMSFDSDYKDLGRQAGEIVVKIISGEKASGIKPVRPRKCVYSLNLATAERIGITFPPNVVRDATEVFK